MTDHGNTGDTGRRVSIAALLLMTVGIVLLLNTSGVIGWGVWLELFRFWPVILIGVGLNMILGPRFPLLSALVVALILAASVGAAYLSSWATAHDDLRAFSYSSPANGANTLELDIDFGAGSLVVDSLVSPDRDILLAADFNGITAGVDENRNGSVAEVALSVDAPGVDLNADDDGWDVDIDLLGMFRSLGDINWDVAVSPDVSVRLDIEGGAAEIDLYLHDVLLEVLDMEIGAADVNIVLPANAGHTDVFITAGAADIDISVPEGVAARINVESTLSSIDVNTGRFPMLGGDYQSPDYATAPNRVAIDIRTGASSVSVH